MTTMDICLLGKFPVCIVHSSLHASGPNYRKVLLIIKHMFLKVSNKSYSFIIFLNYMQTLKIKRLNSIH